VDTDDKLMSGQVTGNLEDLFRFVSRITCIALLVLMAGDILFRMGEGIPAFLHISPAIQVVCWGIHFGFSFLVNRGLDEKHLSIRLRGLYLEVFVLLLFVSSLRHPGYFYFIVLLPITFSTLSAGFLRTLPLMTWALALQLFMQWLLGSHLDSNGSIAALWMNLLIVAAQYGIIGFACQVWGAAQEKFRLSEEENANLVARLGDKYVQLEEVRREMQSQYDQLRKANFQTEESNRKLTTSLAEFYTVQQISQAISSIFDMNELLKFVNDVIIGVMGVSSSTIALRNPQTDRMKVLVSSIFDKRELAVFSDFVNQDIQRGGLSVSHSMLDNDVTAEEYRFVQGRSVRSIACVPLVAKGSTLGIILIEQVIPEAFTSENVRLLEILSQQVSIAIDNARLYNQMQEMATIDGLTGAYNRIHFQNCLREEFDRAREQGGDLALIMCDIDHFKRFNDTHGHQFGDLVLKTLSAHIREHLRKTDLFARYGGEEFVILMPHTTVRQAADKAEELRRSISEMLVSDRVISTSITISMGVSAFPEMAKNEIQLIKSADDALYSAKNSGRNRVQSAGFSGDERTEPYS